MDALAFAEKHLAPYRIKEDEIIPELCPLCHGGEHGDRHTFALNIKEGVYVCKRGSCGAKGRFSDLAVRFGEKSGAHRIADTIISRKSSKQYVLPEVTLTSLTDTIQQYFLTRKISPKTLDAYGIQSDSHGNIVFPFRRNGILEYVKYRKPRKPEPGDRKEWQAKGTRPILFGMDLCVYSKPLVITEGQIDAMALYEAGVANAVSVPSGAENMEWIEHCWDWLERFPSIILFGDCDAPGIRMVQTVARRLGEARCMVVESYPDRPDGKPCKDANEILFFLGADALRETLQAARAVQIKGIIDLAEVVPTDNTLIPRIKTMIPELDEILGGLIESGLTIFTGKPGAGKSTVTGLLLLNAIEQGHNVCAYSGELNKERFQSWIHFQLAGGEYIGLKHDPVKGVQVPYLSYHVQERLIEWYRGKFFLFDNRELFDEDQCEAIMQVFSAAVRRYGCKLFLVDNMMTALADAEDEMRAQGRFANMLKRFANTYGVHVLLVAHPRKTRAGEPIKQNDVAGNSAAERLADNTIVVEKPNLRIIKNREDGRQRVIVCCYCPDSRRVYQADKGDLNRFSWNRQGLTPPAVRANSLPEYDVVIGEMNEPF